MASNRHLGRIIVLQTLYELTFRQECGDTTAQMGDIMTRNISRYKATLDDIAFIENLANGVTAQADSLDAAIQPLAPEWPLNQIARIDHLLLKMGVYELTNKNDVPPKVVINEAVELAKGFGNDNSSKFINGVLGTYLRQIQPESAPKPVKQKKEEP
jgi:N utilization substance protein B